MMPDPYHVRKLAQRVFQNSPALATSDGDLGKMARPTFRCLEYDDDEDDPYDDEGDDPESRGMTGGRAVRRSRAARKARLEESSASRADLLHLQGFDPVVRMTNMEQRRGPKHPPDPFDA